MASTSCFGFGFKKLHKSIQDMLRELDYKGVLLSMQELAGDDQRRLSFMSSHNNKFANAFPWLSRRMPFSVSIQLSSALPSLANLVFLFLCLLRTSASVSKLRVDLPTLL